MKRLAKRGNAKLAAKIKRRQRAIDSLVLELRGLGEEHVEWVGGLMHATDALSRASSRLGSLAFSVAHFKGQDDEDERGKQRHFAELAEQGDPAAQQWLENRGLKIEECV